MATSSMSTGTGDRMENEHDHLQKAVKLLEKIQSEEESGDRYAIVATER